MARTVLVVDDDGEFLDLLAAYVRDAGYTVFTANGAYQAMEILEISPPDAMILDIMMPERSGIEVLEQVRWDTKLSELPVICVSAVTMTTDSQNFIRDFSLGLMDKADLPAVIHKLRQILSPNDSPS